MVTIKLIVANWKMNKTIAEGVDFVRELNKHVKEFGKNEVVICPPFVLLPELSKAMDNRIKLGAQNIFYEDKGAFTGEVSPLMIKGLCEYIVIGHSERRIVFGETSKIINRKVRKALEHNFKVILCVGETLEEREAGKTSKVVGEQLKKGLAGVKDLKNVVIAYEPVWAIGTGKNATPKQVQEMHSFIKGMLGDKRVKLKNNKVMVIYGGSVNQENAKELMKEKGIDGALVGSASLDVGSFLAIIKTC